jgi:hypothetical protein
MPSEQVGTDWTRAVGMLSYQQGVEAFRVTDPLSEAERAALMGGTTASPAPPPLSS